jgi:hypothetical protein
LSLFGTNPPITIQPPTTTQKIITEAPETTRVFPRRTTERPVVIQPGE